MSALIIASGGSIFLGLLSDIKGYCYLGIATLLLVLLAWINTTYFAEVWI